MLTSRGGISCYPRVSIQKQKGLAVNTSSESTPEAMSIHQLDKTFLDIVLNLNATLVAGTSKSVHRIVDLSMNFLSEKGQGALQDFYNLYFANQSMESQKSDVNKEVDDLFDAIQSEMSNGSASDPSQLDFSHIVEDEEKRNSRLAISAVQKQLESLITLETSLREKLVPAMMSMQFEDLVRQRVQRIDTMWKSVFSVLAQNREGALESLKEKSSLQAPLMKKVFTAQ
jgi:hypothetical protein